MSSKLWNRLDSEAADLWARPRAEVREQLIVHYMPFADALATRRSSRNRRVDPDDVRADAYEALIRAVDSYDPHNERGATFTTYAGWTLRGATHEAERKADWVNHKVRAELGDSLPRMMRFPDESDGKNHRYENLVPDREPETNHDKPDLAAEMDRWSTVAVKLDGKLGLPTTVREVVDLLLDCAWNVSECVRRAQVRDTLVNGNPISEELLLACANDADAVALIRTALEAVGVCTTICTFGVYQPPREDVDVSERPAAMKRVSRATEAVARHHQLLFDMTTFAEREVAA